ncbi:MAG TPA: MauE/DoxX family redox-associated membrane protein [Actinomycetota bacterium]|nr:MauE/DoxX family redox-associated membrane protein [Actinomycetota bacterium]
MSLRLILRVVLAIVFAGAAIGKLQDLDDSRQQVRDFGLPDVIARPIGTLLPAVELLVAAGLVIAATSWWAAWAALALMGAFIVGIAVNMTLGRRPDCRCFGPLHIETIGWRVLSRDLLLAALAAAILLRV